MITREDVCKLAMKPVSNPNSKIGRYISILGGGGVGSNLLRLTCLDPARFYINLYDYDTVALHNLNRTSMFSLEQARSCWRKVDALRSNARSYMFSRSGIKNETPIVHHVSVDKNTSVRAGVIIDARDTLDVEKMVPNTWLKLGYDGGSSIAFTFLPHIVAKNVFDLNSNVDNTYAVVPSFYVPAALLSCLAFRFMEFLNLIEIPDSKAGTVSFDIDCLADEVTYQWDAP